MSTAIPIFSFLLALNLATTSWTFKSELDILDGCRWLSRVPSERRLKRQADELLAVEPYATGPVKDPLDSPGGQYGHLDQKTFELLKQLCGWPLLRAAQVEFLGDGGNSRQVVLSGDVASRLVKQRRGPDDVLRKRKPGKSAPTELDPTFMLMGIGRK